MKSKKKKKYDPISSKTNRLTLGYAIIRDIESDVKKVLVLGIIN